MDWLIMQYSYGLYERNLQVSTKQGISWKKKINADAALWI